MHITKPLVTRLGFGLAALIALAVVIAAVGVSSDSPEAEATGPTPIANDGSLGGIVDILVHDGTKAVGAFYCIGKNDHQVNGTETDGTPDDLQIHLQCNIDTPGLGDTGETPPSWCSLDNTAPAPCTLSEPGADAVPGPPPPPPYTVLTPAYGTGLLFGDGAGCPNDPTPCSVTTTCFEDVGSPDGLGPNIISRATLDDVLSTNPSSGTVDIWFNQSNADCKALTPKDTATLSGLPINSYQITDKSLTSTGVASPWRAAGVSDYDGDGCSDADELTGGNSDCGDDPQNPSDSFSDPNSVDLTGIYSLTARAIRADCGNPCADNPIPGAYYYCRAVIQHDTGTDDVTVRPYCYTDIVGIDVNTEGYPGATGDGFSGGPPPGPDTGGGDFAYGDIDFTHSELSGTFNPTTENFELTGCFEDQDGNGGLGYVYVEAVVSAHQLPGTVDIYANETEANCLAGTPATSGGTAELSIVQPNPGEGLDYDQDDDGVSTATELGDDPADCGLRDPFNRNDFGDMSVPRDGVIDLSNDILGTILEYAPGGYVSGAVDHTGDTVIDIYDRGGIIDNGVGEGGNWNRHEGDGVIDLSNDILGTILQYHPSACP